MYFMGAREPQDEEELDFERDEDLQGLTGAARQLARQRRKMRLEYHKRLKKSPSYQLDSFLDKLEEERQRRSIA